LKREDDKNGPQNGPDAERVEFKELEEFVNDFGGRRPGAVFVTETVPMIKRIESAGSDPAFKGLYWLSVDGELNVATSFYATSELVNAIRPRIDAEADHLRVECVLVETSGAGEVYRTPYATRIEAVDAEGNVLWSVADGKPKRIKIRY
jgi:hypothetical protein